jgi:serine phosphatase RsbU (regulator of sigma subunit)
LDIARGIQRSLLPKSLPQLRGFGLAAHCESARQVGGDFYDLLQISETSLLLIIADVMGKGVPAALFAALLRSLVRAHPEWSYRPAELLTRINQLLFDDLSAVNMFITAQIVLLDLDQHRAIIGSAGHCPVLLATAHGRHIQSVTAEGMPLGVLRDSVFEEATVPLDSTSRLILYTDGVTDSRNPSGECFSEARLHAWIEACWKAATTADALKASLISVLKSFEANAALQDDRTFLIAVAEEPTGRAEEL